MAVHKPILDPILLAVTAVSTFDRDRLLTRASGFFLERDGRLFLITSRHVAIDEPSGHQPDRLELEIHTDPDNMAQSAQLSLPLYDQGKPLWRGATDSAGSVDVAALEIQQGRLPAGAVIRAFAREQVAEASQRVELGAAVLIVGFPLGFHDALHHVPVARQAIVASPFGLRFQGQGYFLTDGRTHRGSSGAPVVLRRSAGRSEDRGALPWHLLGVHSARLDVAAREVGEDEALGLNCAWYADVLHTLTAP